jgi:hypothetical protein
MDDQLEERVATLERAVTDGEGDPAALADAAVTAERLDDLETAAEDLEDRVAELEAATQALRGYVGEVRSVNREVEERADLALSRVEDLAGGSNTSGDTRDEPAERSPRNVGEGSQRRERCGRCGQPTDGEPGTGGESAAAAPGPRQEESPEPTGGDRPNAAALDGGSWDPGASRSPRASWAGSGPSGSREGGGQAGEGSGADGPIARLRKLL